MFWFHRYIIHMSSFNSFSAVRDVLENTLFCTQSTKRHLIRESRSVEYGVTVCCQQCWHQGMGQRMMVVLMEPAGSWSLRNIRTDSIVSLLVFWESPNNRVHMQSNTTWHILQIKEIIHTIYFGIKGLRNETLWHVLYMHVYVYVGASHKDRPSPPSSINTQKDWISVNSELLLNNRTMMASPLPSFLADASRSCYCIPYPFHSQPVIPV